MTLITEKKELLSRAEQLIRGRLLILTANDTRCLYGGMRILGYRNVHSGCCNNKKKERTEKEKERVSNVTALRYGGHDKRERRP